MWIILLLLALIPTIDLYIINSFEKTIVTTALKGLMLAAALAILFVFLYAMALQSTFENTIKEHTEKRFPYGNRIFPMDTVNSIYNIVAYYIACAIR